MKDLDIVRPGPLVDAQAPEPGASAQLLAAWLTDLADTTRVAYMRDLGYFADWGGLPGDVPTALATFFAFDARTRNFKVSQYKTEMLKTLSPRTANRRLATLRSLVSKAVEMGVLDEPLRVRNAKQPEKGDHKDISPEHYWRLISYLEFVRDDAPPGSLTERRAIRDLAIIRLLRDRALRRKEVGTIELADVDVGRQTVTVRPKGHQGSRVARELAGPAWEALVDWLEVRGNAPGPLLEYTDLSSINKMVAARASAAGLPDHVHPHLFRRSGAEAAVKAASDIGQAQALTGHKSLDMLLYYAKRKDQKTADLVEKIGKKEKNK